MGLDSILVAAAQDSGDFLVGVLLGGCLGYLVGPAIRSWQIYREWVEASREVRLADRLINRIEVEAEREEQDLFTEADEEAFRATWRTHP